ncbi:hypothetical protein PybrP1_001568 [[Pythium] brassicae (nom. inval.)]|nr:hypothetical protein PybrP1_001568 [[Pythium] brassicae (nom. inval.)]
MDAPRSRATTAATVFTARAAPAASTARRVAASERLTAEHAVQRQRAQAEPIVVAWKLERRANGQELISLSSDESSGDESAQQAATASASVSVDESEHEDEEEDFEVKRARASLERKRKRGSFVFIDTSSSSSGGDDNDGDDDSGDGGGCSSDGGACEVVDAREPQVRGSHAFELSHTTADGDTTPETNGSSCGDSDVRYKSEADALPPAALAAAESLVAIKRELKPAAADAVAPATLAPPSLDPVGELVATVPRKAIPLMRRKKLDEEDAAFLLFYGISETPTAYILGLIVEYIDRCVGDRSALASRYLKVVLWRKLNAHVNAALEVERAVRSEWMKIVFSSSDPSMRQEIYRTPLLPRPVRITVRPLQLVRKRPPGSGLDAPASATSDAKHARSVEKSKERGSSKRSSNSKSGAAAAPNGRILGGGRGPGSLESTPLSSPQRLKPASHKRKAATATALDALTAVQPYSPRKHRRRNGSNLLVDAELPMRRASGPRTPVEVMTPLTLNQCMAGTNPSLPVGMRPFDEDAGYRKGPCVQVSPLLNMTAAELESHIKSVRNEGRLKSFETLGEVLGKLMADAHNYRGAFNSPVDPIALNLPTYTSIVKNPMDLGTVKKKLGDGQYIEIEDFVRDVRLVFENAKLFNAPGHSVHTSAELLLKRFESELKAGLDRQHKRSSAPKHACNACHGHTCALCTQQCLSFALPHLQCSGSCGTDIRKGSIYYVTRDGTRVWCHKCRSRLVRDRGPAAALSSQLSQQSSSSSSSNSSSLFSEVPSTDFSQASQVFSQGSQVFSQGSQGSQDGDVSGDVLDSMVRVKCDAGVEPWVKCSECARWMHQVCGLFNPVRGEYAAEHDFVCPLCCWRHKASAPPPSSSLHSLLNPALGDREASRSSCLNIPPCNLSQFLQSFLRRELAAVGEGAAAETLNVRVLSFPGEKMTLPESVVRAFDENANALAHLLPARDVSAQRLPPAATYLSRGIYLFQQHDGVEVSLFSLFAQEFGDDCELAANRRSVYVAYIDSIRYLAPASVRTSAYHLIMLAYFDYVRRHGFDRVHIWSCPPQKRISYVYWCRPAFQKTPSAEHLRSWYSRLLAQAQARDIVADWTTLYDRYLAHEDSVALPVKDEAAASLIATRGVTARSVDPAELAWPAAELPPIFDGDFIPAELERILGRLGARNGKVRRATDSAKNAAIGSSGGKHMLGGGGGGGGGKHATAVRIKEEPLEGGAGGVAVAGTPPPPVEFKLREIFERCQGSVRRMKQDLLVVRLAPVPAGERVPCQPERTVPAWCLRVPRFFGSRFMFHQLCSHAGYQFDSLRRAKHSTMMILHHYLNEHVTQANVFCRECSLLITHAEYWACARCDRFALCDSCFQRDGREHPHALRFGGQLNVRVPIAPPVLSPLPLPLPAQPRQSPPHEREHPLPPFPPK